MPGVTQVWSDRSTAALDITGLAAGSAVGVQGNGTNGVAAVTATYVAGATAATLALNGGMISTGGTAPGAVTINGAGLTSATINSTGGSNIVGGVALANTVKAVTVNATSNVTTGNITGVAADTVLTINGAGTANVGTIAANVKEVNAAGNSGGATLTMNAVATTKYVGSTGNDVITTGGVALTTGEVDAGAGTADRLVVANTTDLNSTTLGAKYKNFEQLEVNTGVTVNLDHVAATNTIDTVRVNRTTDAATGVTNLTAAQAEKVQIIASHAGTNQVITIGVKNATNPGQIDTVKAALTTTTATGALQNINLTGLTLTGVEKLELTGNGANTATTGAVTLTTTNATALDSIKLVNAGNANVITVAAGHTATNLNIDATGSAGTVTINAAAYNTTTGASLTGGAGNDTIIGSQRFDVIKGGAGNDTITGSNAGEVQTIQFAAVDAAGTGTVTITVGGVTTAATAALANDATAATVGTAVLGVLNANADLLAAGYTFAHNGTGLITINAPANAGNIATATIGGTATFAAANTISTTQQAGVVVSANELTGGEGNDNFVFGLGGDTVTNVQTIKDFNAGGATAATAVDKIVINGGTAAVNVITLTAAQQSALVAEGVTLAQAVNLLTNGALSAEGATAQFTHGTDTYILYTGTGAGGDFAAANDLLVKVTGVVGTLDNGDFTLAA